MNDAINICAILVTFNRKDLLKQSLTALLNQSLPLHKIIIVDNASTDGTYEFLMENALLSSKNIDYLKLDNNYGGAGGFHFGIKRALELKQQWLYLLDDDAMVQENTLEEMARQLQKRQSVYISVALDEQSGMCWPVSLGIDNTTQRAGAIKRYDDLPEEEIIAVNMAPFLGFTIHSDLVREIGLPEKEYFISGDDAEYASRVVKLHYPIMMVKQSILIHPMPPRYIVDFFGYSFYCLRLDPWRRYYDVRNRLLNAKKQFGLGLGLWSVLFTILLKLLFVFINEKCRWRQLKAHGLGIVHGLSGIKGKKVEPGKL